MKKKNTKKKEKGKKNQKKRRKQKKPEGKCKAKEFAKFICAMCIFRIKQEQFSVGYNWISVFPSKERNEK